MAANAAPQRAPTVPVGVDAATARLRKAFCVPYRRSTPARLDALSGTLTRSTGFAIFAYPPVAARSAAACTHQTTSGALVCVSGVPGRVTSPRDRLSRDGADALTVLAIRRVDGRVEILNGSILPCDAALLRAQVLG